jgi:hypothetical protein
MFKVWAIARPTTGSDIAKILATVATIDTGRHDLILHSGFDHRQVPTLPNL